MVRSPSVVACLFSVPATPCGASEGTGVACCGYHSWPFPPLASVDSVRVSLVVRNSVLQQSAIVPCALYQCYPSLLPLGWSYCPPVWSVPDPRARLPRPPVCTASRRLVLQFALSAGGTVQPGSGLVLAPVGVLPSPWSLLQSVAANLSAGRWHELCSVPGLGDDVHGSCRVGRCRSWMHQTCASLFELVVCGARASALGF